MKDLGFWFCSNFKHPVKITERFIFVHADDLSILLKSPLLYLSKDNYQEIFFKGKRVEIYSSEEELEWLMILK
jgi:hypothetical protein